MSEQRIDTGADAATSTDADPGEGVGTGGPAPDRRGAMGGDDEMAQPTPDRPTGTGPADSGDTEGESYLRDTEAKQAAGQQRRDGRSGAGEQPARRPSGPAGTSGTGSDEVPEAGARADDPRAGEVGAEPSERRRERDPGSVAEEFSDRAGVAPDDDIAHPSI